MPLRLLLSCCALLLCCALLTACPPVDGAGDALLGDGTQDVALELPCGDGLCAGPAESAATCPRDCPADCGDGLCTAGEFCAVCAADCDCDTLAATPPMGWNSWNRFGCDINEELIKQMADALVSEGFASAGYNYLNLDDCWQASRAEDGSILEDPTAFPSGMAALADYVHGKGLRFGLYTCAGTQTCQQRPGSFGFEEQDAASYAAWGVDYVKVDWCFTKGMDSQQRYAAMHEAIVKAGRPMILSICNWGIDQPWSWGPQYGQLWRTTIDIMDTWASMLYNFLGTEAHADAAGPGHWNDPDMLEVGNGGLDAAEARAHFSLWAMLAAPLIAGNDLRALDEETKAILLNQEVIAVDQDPLGVAAKRLSGEGVVGVWARPLAAQGARAVVLLNGSAQPQLLGFQLSDLGLQGEDAVLRDLWLHQDLPDQGPRFQRQVEPHSAVLLKVLGTD